MKKNTFLMQPFYVFGNYTILIQLLMKKIKSLRLKTLFFAGLIMISYVNVQASDVAGAQITWQKVGTDSFLVTLTGYRDCNGIPFPTASVPVKCASTGQTVITITISKPSPVDITPVCGSSCTRCQSSSCSFPYGIEKYVFQKLVVLSGAGSCCDLIMECSMGARSSSITTGAANAQLYISAKLNRCMSFDNNSPQISNNPVNIICVGQDFIFNLGAYDLDKDTSGKLLDSISYEWTKPQTGAGTYTSWTGSYTYDKPVFFWGFPSTNLTFPRGLHLDNSSGDISFRPMKVEQTIMAVKMSEWRKINGTRTKIGETTCEFLVIIISCPNNNAPILAGPFYQEVNVGDTVAFSIATNDYDTKDTLTIDWSKNIQGATWSSNNKQVKHPTGNLTLKADSTMAGNLYSFTASVKDDACPVNGKSSRVYQIYVKPICAYLSVTIVKKDLGCNKYVFYPDSLNSNYKYAWQGLSNDNFSSSGDSLVRQYSESKTIKIRLTTTYYNNCFKTYDLTFTSDSLLNVDLPTFAYLGNPDTMTVYPKVQFAHGAFKFKWSDGDTVKLNKLLSLKGNKTLVMYLTVTDTNGCTALDSIILYKNVVNVELGADKIKCKGSGVTLSYNITNFGSSTYVSTEWYRVGYATPLSFNTQYYTSDTGLFAVKINFTTGLVAYDTIKISNYLVPVVDAGPYKTLCSNDGLFELVGTPTATAGSYWTGTAVSKINDKYYFDPHYSGICNNCSYNVYYYYKDSFGCTTSNGKNLKVVYSSIKPEIGSYPNQCIDNPPLKLNASHGPGTWTGKGVSNGYFNPATAGAGTHQIIYRVGNEPCYEYDTTWITVSAATNISLSTINNKTDFCIGSGLIALIAAPTGGVLSGDIYNGIYFNADTLAGTYIINYQYTDSTGCTFDKILTLKTGDPIVKIPAQNNIFCEGKRITVNSTTNVIGAPKWSAWPASDGAFIQPINEGIMNYQPGTQDLISKQIRFYLSTTDTLCKFAKDSITVIIADTPEVDFYADPPIFVQAWNNYRVKFHNTSKTYTASASYIWDFGDGSFAFSENPEHDYYDLKKYTISLKITDNYNCISNKIRENYINISTLKENVYSSVDIHPNPSGSKVRVVTSFVLKELSLSNTMGQVIFYAENINKNEIFLDRFVSGVYLVKITDMQGNHYFRKIIFE